MINMARLDMSKNSRENDVNQLPEIAVSSVRQMLERMLKEVIRLEENNKQREADKASVKRHKKRITDAASLLAGNLYALPYRRAITATSAVCGFSEKQLMALIPKAKSIAERKTKQVRNRQIMQKVAKGWTNSQIGDFYGLHGKSIARIIAQIRAGGI